MKHSKRTFALILTDKASKNGAIICKGYYVEVILKRIGVIGHENKTYCKANESCDELKHENTEYTKCLGFKVTEKQKNHNLCTGFLKCIWIQQTYFSIASKICSTKQTSSISVSNRFKVMYS